MKEQKKKKISGSNLLKLQKAFLSKGCICIYHLAFDEEVMAVHTATALKLNLAKRWRTLEEVQILYYCS